MKVNFKDEGLEVFTAINGQDAVDKLKADGQRIKDVIDSALQEHDKNIALNRLSAPG